MLSQATGPKENVFVENERQRPPFNGSFSQVSSGANSASFQVPAVKECFNVSDPGTSGISRSYSEALIADDPELQKSIRGLEAMLRVCDSLGPGQSPSLVPVTKVSASLPARSGAGETDAVPELLEIAAGAGENDAVFALSERVSGVETDPVPTVFEIDTVRVSKRCIDPGTGDVRRVFGSGKLRGVADAAAATAGENERIIALPEVTESALAKVKGLAVASATAGATVGESQGIIGLRESQIPSLNSSGCLSVHACASLPSAPAVSARVCPVPSSSAVSAAVAHARFTPMHDAHKSWSDTVRSQGPTGRRCTKGGVSGPAEDLRPVPEVEAGVNFRPTGWVRGQVAGSLPGRQPGTGTRTSKGSVVTPSLHPEVLDSLFVSPGPGKRIRQSMGWTKVCGTTQSGIWVLKGNARTCMLPENLDHPSGGMEEAGFIQDCLGYARARLSVVIQVWTWSSSQTTN